ncbi:MAG: hypothetical protein NC127_07410 [Muribaculum sp.]|nr:hypothetical protein [Muribaculum sp.]
MKFSLDSTALAIVVEARCAIVDEKNGRGDKYWWKIAWDYVDSANFKYAKITSKNSDFGDILDKRQVVITAGSVTGGKDVEAHSTTVSEDVGEVRQFNSVALEWRDGRLNLFFGAKTLNKVMSIVESRPVGSEGRILSSSPVDVEFVVVESFADPAKELASGWTLDKLRDRLTATMDAKEGIWRFFDRETDDHRARLGGKYALACVSDGAGGYLLLYCDGAEVNSSSWIPLMIKGRLKATQYENNYDLIWYDSMMEPLSDEDFVYFNLESAMMTLNFPIHKSKIRLSKTPVSQYMF